MNIYGFVVVEMGMGENQSSKFLFNFRLARFTILPCTTNSVWCVVALRIIILVPAIKPLDSKDSVTILGKNLPTRYYCVANQNNGLPNERVCVGTDRPGLNCVFVSW